MIKNIKICAIIAIYFYYLCKKHVKWHASHTNEKDMKGLTIKQENFCNYYIESGNTSDAYRRAYSCEKMKDKQVWEESCKLLSNPKVAQRAKELQEEQKNKSDITKERILQELSGIAFSSIASMHNTWIERKEFDELSDKEKSAIKSISTKILKKISEQVMLRKL